MSENMCSNEGPGCCRAWKAVKRRSPFKQPMHAAVGPTLARSIPTKCEQPCKYCKASCRAVKVIVKSSHTFMSGHESGSAIHRCNICNQTHSIIIFHEGTETARTMLAQTELILGMQRTSGLSIHHVKSYGVHVHIG